MNFGPKGKKYKILGPTLVGLFLFCFLVFYSLHLSLPTSEDPVRFYSSEKRDDLRRLLVHQIKKAKRSILLRTYALTDASLVHTLKEKGKEGIEIALFYDRKASPDWTELEDEYVHFHPVKGKGLIHEKIWIFDEETLFLGSANLTPSSLRMHDNMMVGLFAPELAKALYKTRPEKLEGTIGTWSYKYFSLPSQEALQAVIDTLQQARDAVSLSLFTFTHPDIAETLKELHKNGVKISLTLDQTTARGASLKVKDQLASEGIHVNVSQGLNLYHYKWGVVDNATHIIGSANWTKGAFQKNHDFILILY
ncbi:MAG: hypothetical protein KDK71_04750 [Chlamydiia bacterium]|nr:hypothetical protein [Chlamydiia bacterium]